MIGHTAYYFTKTLNSVVSFDAEDVLNFSYEITQLSYAANYTFDHSAMESVIDLTDKILADHKVLLYKNDSLNCLVGLLDLYVNSGWIQALHFLWRLDEAFR
jgi:hypothetical protein